MQTPDLIFTHGSAQLLAQGVSEQMVIAIPRAMPGQRQDEQIVLFTVTEHLLAIPCLGDRVAQAGIELIQDGGVQEERANILWLALEDFFPEVVVAQVDAANELLDKLLRLVSRPPAQCRTDHLQPNHPSLGALVEQPDLAGCEVQVERVEVLQRLLRGELQVALRDHQDFAARLEASQAQRWHRATDQHKSHRGRQMLHQPVYGLVDR